VILDLGVVRELGGALPYQAEGPLIDATLVEDPSQGIGDVWVLWGRLFGDLRELERLLLVAAVLGIEPGEVVRRRGEARLLSENLLIGLLGLSDVAFAVVDSRCEDESRQILRVDLEQLVELGQSLIVLSRGGVKIPERDVGSRQAGIELDRLEVCSLGRPSLATRLVRGPEEQMEAPCLWREGDLLLDPVEG